MKHNTGSQRALAKKKRVTSQFSSGGSVYSIWIKSSRAEVSFEIKTMSIIVAVLRGNWFHSSQAINHKAIIVSDILQVFCFVF